MAEADDTGSGSGGAVNAPDHSSGSERAEQFATGVGAALEGRLGEQREAHFELEGEGSDQSHHDERADDLRYPSRIPKAVSELTWSPRGRGGWMQLVGVEDEQ